jgi:hypothetical protein
MSRFTITNAEAARLLQISYLVHLRFRALDDQHACEHVGFATLAGRVIHEGDMLQRARAPTVPSTPTPPHRNAQGPPLPSQASHLEQTIDRVCQDLRRSLPADQAEAVISAMSESKKQLRKGDKVKVPAAKLGDKPADLGRNYRIGDGVGALAREQRAFTGRAGMIAAQDHSPHARGLHTFDSDRIARLNTADQEVLWTLRKVLKQNREEFAHLNSKQKLCAMSRVLRQQMHEESLKLKKKVKGDDGGGGSDSSSSGDSCGSSSQDSRRSEDTYTRDSFCTGSSSPSRPVGRGGGGGDDGGGDSDSSTISNSDSDGDDDKHANKRRNSVNGLGTPKKKSSSIDKLSRRQLLKLPHSAAARQQLVLLGNDDLPMWKVGSAKFKNGFSWESYLHHKQAFDNYTQHRGRYSERTFKSTIHANLVPVVCASCGFSRSKWAMLSDSKLILGIEKVLRPSRSTDFAMELKALKIMREGDEALQASYCAFAEKFLAKVAEAEDAGRPIKSVVVKAAFKTAIEKEVALKTWFEGDRWRGVSRAHSRLLRKLREARSWEAISKTVLKAKMPSNRDDQPDAADAGGDNYRRAPRRRSNNTRGARGVGRQNGNEQQGNGNGRQGRRQNQNRSDQRNSADKPRGQNNSTAGRGPQFKRAGSNSDRDEKRRSWQGYDSRGESWHDNSELFECYKKPCNAPFCQRCARHGHTADTCRVPDGVEGLNTSGYFQEKRPGKVGPKKPPARMNHSGKRRQIEESDDYQSDDGGSSRRGGSGRNCL